jgi:CRP-like cAMP-binding protein
MRDWFHFTSIYTPLWVLAGSGLGLYGISQVGVGALITWIVISAAIAGFAWYSGVEQLRQGRKTVDALDALKPLIKQETASTPEEIARAIVREVRAGFQDAFNELRRLQSENLNLRKMNAESASANETIEQFRQVDFLSELSEEEFRQLLPAVLVRNFAAGDVIVRKGDIGDSFFVVRKGTVEVTSDERQVHLYDLIHPASLGKMAVLTGAPYAFTVRARTDAELLEIDREGFAELFKAHPEIASKMGMMLAGAGRERSTRIQFRRASGASREDSLADSLIPKRLHDIAVALNLYSEPGHPAVTIKPTKPGRRHTP